MATVDESFIGDTPLLELAVGVEPTVYAKVEWLNLPSLPYGGGSIKSRVARRMLDGAERRGELDPDADRTLVEPSSGNTGAAIARVGCGRGYDVEIVMLDDTAPGKVEAVREAGAEVTYVDAEKGYDATIERCEELIESDPESYYWPNQYDNPDNPGAHHTGTAPELWAQTGGDLDCFVAGVGTGGTITGIGRRLGDRVDVVGYEPSDEPHDIEGLRYLRTGEHPHTGIYDETVLDEKRYVDTADAWAAARDLRETYADRPPRIVDPGAYNSQTIRNHLRVDREFLVGPSSGGNVALVRQLAEEGFLTADDTVAFLLCDRGDRYPDSLWADVLD
jgi:cysteine synthase B